MSAKSAASSRPSATNVFPMTIAGSFQFTNPIVSFNSGDHPRDIYCLVDETGGGLLVPWIKYARSSGDYNILEEYLDTAVRSFMYNGGKGKLVAISELVKIRNDQRNALLGALRRKKGRGQGAPNILDYINQEQNEGGVLKALKILDGANFSNQHKILRYREIVWDINQRGKMGETLLHICLLHNTTEMNELAKQIIIRFPKIVNDIFISEDYYGFSPLHQAIVNEDLAMVYFLLKNDADVHQRCYGSFFCADDQKSSRSDSLEYEWVDLNQNTNYTGQMYWGEYPLSYAACTNQEDCFRLLRAFKADPNHQDTNGNTVLHMCVIHNVPEMFTLAFSLGANLHIKNNLQLSPLALAARLANKKIYDLILSLEMDIVWRYRDVVCKAYPLVDIDTIGEEAADLNMNSVLANIVYGDKEQHLEFFDGFIDQLLQKKWETFGKKRLLYSLFWFFFLLTSFYAAFMTRRVSLLVAIDDILDNQTRIALNSDLSLEVIMALNDEEKAVIEQCHLLFYGISQRENIRFFSEMMTVFLVVLHIARLATEVQDSGILVYWETIKSFPEKCLFKISLALIVLMIPVRFSCGVHSSFLFIENILAITSVMMMTMHFLFFCRGLKFVGPFVLMVYKIILVDMLRFFLIYLVFLLCFSQSFSIIFRACEREEIVHMKRMNITTDDYQRKFTNIMDTPWSSIMRMFIMSVGEFSAFYRNLHECKSNMAQMGKALFIIYELLVTVMLLNLLIAMMTRTYEKIAEAEKEWKRQWAKVILMIEQSLSSFSRKMALYSYSRPLRSDIRQRAFIVLEKGQGPTPEIHTEPTRKRSSMIRLSPHNHLSRIGSTRNWKPK
ncbi:unnamed protein product, partial [Mesorhabditis belari]|uniref:Ion transport domain-containing protein n=1 Tax=Mesorhabditis belari TaxID=2138241 RepID=A0AAF3FL19_9BILA